MKLILLVFFLLFDFILGNNASTESPKNETTKSGGSGNSTELPCGLVWTNQGIEFFSKNKSEIEKPAIQSCLCGLISNPAASELSRKNALGIKYKLRIDVGSLKCTYDYELNITWKYFVHGLSKKAFMRLHEAPNESKNKTLFITYAEALTMNKSLIIENGLWLNTKDKSNGGTFYSTATKNLTNMCETYPEKSIEYNLLKILKYSIAGGNDCPIAADLSFPVPHSFSPLKLTSNVKLPCGLNGLKVKLRSPENQLDFVEWQFEWKIPNNSKICNAFK